MKKTAVLTFIIYTFCILSACKTINNPSSPPNFIIIFADDLGYGDLGCYGHPTINTPHLDKMAAEGMRLTQFYMAASICTPSRAGLLTGKLPIRSGMCGKRGVLFPDSAGGLQDSETTIAEVLKAKNYATACIGKWHLGHLPQYLPTNHGFDYYFGIPYSNDMSPEQNNWKYAQAAFPPTPLIENIDVIESEPNQSNLTQRYTQKAIEFIKNNQQNPFFLYLPHTFPHTPLYVDEGNENRSKRGLYGDVVEVLDESVGQILVTLKDLQLAENTFVLFTSDNGPWGWAGINGGSQGLLKGKKGSPWEGGFRVPAIAWMPKTVPANTTSRAIATSMDLLPTFMAMAGIDTKNEEPLDGKNIITTFTENKAVQAEVFYYANHHFKAYRNGDWKIFINDPDPWNDEHTQEDMPLLFNINHDPSEVFNVADKHPAIVEKLTNLVEQHLQSVEIIPSQLDTIHPDYLATFKEFNPTFFDGD